LALKLVVIYSRCASTQDLSVDLVLGYDFVNQFSTQTWQQTRVDNYKTPTDSKATTETETQTHVEPEKSKKDMETQTYIDRQQKAGQTEPPTNPGQRPQIPALSGLRRQMPDSPVLHLSGKIEELYDERVYIIVYSEGREYSVYTEVRAITPAEEFEDDESEVESGSEVDDLNIVDNHY
jgi:hypothetical protein